MAEEQDDASKTEEPTPKRLKDARDKGQVANSREVASWMMLFTLGMLILIYGPKMLGDLKDVMLRYIERPHEIALGTPDEAQLDMLAVLFDLFLVMSVPFVAAMIAAFFAVVAQIGLIWSTEPLNPKLDKISPIKGFKRLFSLRSLTEFAKGIAKLGIIGFVVALILVDEFEIMSRLLQEDMIVVLHEMWEACLKIMGAALFVLAFIVFLDIMYTRYEHTKQLRMTRQEVKDEYKQTEGDPMVKSRLRQIRQERARRRMMAAVPDADVVVTNPTHYAVAMKYDQTSMTAPMVTAKGADLIARRIREIAEENDVPIVNNPPLARALYAGVEIDEEVPPEHYHAVAEVIGYVMRLKNPNKYREYAQ